MNNTIEYEEVRKVEKETEHLTVLVNALIEENKLAGETICNLENRLAEQAVIIYSKRLIYLTNLSS